MNCELRVGDDGEAGGGITRSRLNHRSGFLLCGVDAVVRQGIAGEGRPRERRVRDCRRGQTDELKQMSHQKISTLYYFYSWSPALRRGMDFVWLAHTRILLKSTE